MVKSSLARSGSSSNMTTEVEKKDKVEMEKVEDGGKETVNLPAERAPLPSEPPPPYDGYHRPYYVCEEEIMKKLTTYDTEAVKLPTKPEGVDFKSSFLPCHISKRALFVMVVAFLILTIVAFGVMTFALQNRDEGLKSSTKSPGDDSPIVDPLEPITGKTPTPGRRHEGTDNDVITTSSKTTTPTTTKQHTTTRIPWTSQRRTTTHNPSTTRRTTTRIPATTRPAAVTEATRSSTPATTQRPSTRSTLSTRQTTTRNPLTTRKTTTQPPVTTRQSSTPTPTRPLTPHPPIVPSSPPKSTTSTLSTTKPFSPSTTPSPSTRRSTLPSRALSTSDSSSEEVTSSGGERSTTRPPPVHGMTTDSSSEEDSSESNEEDHHRLRRWGDKLRDFQD